MSMTNVIEQAYHTVKSGIAAEEIQTGELVTTDVNGDLVRALHGLGDIRGVATASRGIELPYSAGDRVAYGGNSDEDVVHVRTIEDENAPAPSIEDGTVVGVIEPKSGPDAPEGEGRIVEEGYSATTDDGAGETATYTEENGNFTPIGRAYRDSSCEHDDLVRVVRN